jgi:hypothetical protein
MVLGVAAKCTNALRLLFSVSREDPDSRRQQTAKPPLVRCIDAAVPAEQSIATRQARRAFPFATGGPLA